MTCFCLYVFLFLFFSVGAEEIFQGEGSGGEGGSGGGGEGGGKWGNGGGKRGLGTPLSTPTFTFSCMYVLQFMAYMYYQSN